ncbi:MAG: hypothetical protein J6X33_04010 [Clostridiales bacterium]|nr:hypothetical protein [Clostridiales bacterium]
MTEYLPILIGCSCAFIITLLLMKFLPLSNVLIGHDRGRLYAEGSSVNIGKPTGVGFYFVIVFCLTVIIVNILTGLRVGILYVMILTAAAMVTGVLDDRSKDAWNEYIKGAMDAVLALFGSFIAVYFFGRDFIFGITGTGSEFHVILYIVLAFILYIVSINAVNATDGIDGLSGTLTVLSVITAGITAYINGTMDKNGLLMGCALIAVLIAYLIFNFNPSKVLMGDAGSRAIGFFLAFYFMYLKVPFAFLIIGLPFLIDGGLSILKITIGRLTKRKIIILPGIITPIHDELRKKHGMSVKKTWGTLVLTALVIDIIYVVICIIVHRAG